MITLSYLRRIAQKLSVVLILIVLLSIPVEIKAEKYSKSSDLITMIDIAFRLPESPELSDYIKFGLANNSDIKAAYNIYRAEYEKINSATKLPNPSLSFGYFLESIETAVGPQEYRIGLMQPIPFFGKLNLKGNIQEIQAQKAYQNLANKINGLRKQIKTVYYDNFYLNSSIDITREQINLIEQWIGQMEAKFKTGQSSYPDLIKAQIAQLKLEDNLKSLLDQRKVLTDKFKALLNTKNISIVETPSTIKTELTDTSRNYTEQIKENNPELQNSDYTVELQKKSIKLSRLNYYPDFGIGVDYIFTGDKYTSSSAKVSESGKDPVVLKFSLSLPIWWGKNRSQIKTAKFQHQAALDKKQDLENQLSAELSDILNKIQDNYRKIELYQNELIPKSEQLLQVTETAYMNGKSDFLSLIDAQRNHLELELILKKARAEYLKTRADLEKLIGRTL